MAFLSILMLISFVIINCLYLLYNIDYNESLIPTNLEILNSRWEFIPLHFMFLIRLVFCLIIWLVNFYLIIDRKGLDIVALGSDGNPKKVHIVHAERFTAFTMWAWSLQGLYFASLMILYIIDYCNMVSFHIYLLYYLRLFILITFEISFGIAFMVSTTVSYVLIPGMIKNRLSVDLFFKPVPLLTHNANVIFMVVELLLSKIPILPNHYPSAILFASCYVIFSWIWLELKGVVYYFFLDYNRKYSLLWHIGLLMGVYLFYYFGVFFSNLMETQSPYALLLLVFTSVVLKTSK